MFDVFGSFEANETTELGVQSVLVFEVFGSFEANETTEQGVQGVPVFEVSWSSRCPCDLVFC